MCGWARRVAVLDCLCSAGDCGFGRFMKGIGSPNRHQLASVLQLSAPVGGNCSQHLPPHLCSDVLCVLRRHQLPCAHIPQRAAQLCGRAPGTAQPPTHKGVSSRRHAALYDYGQAWTCSAKLESSFAAGASAVSCPCVNQACCSCVSESYIPRFCLVFCCTPDPPVPLWR